MRKTILTILGIVLLASSAFGSDVLFKMVMNGNSNVNIASGANQDLSSYYHFYDLGGSALVHNGKSNDQILIKDGCARLGDSNGDYIKITLPEGKSLQVGDTISILGLASQNTYYFVYSAGGSSGRPSGTTQYKITMNSDYIASYVITSEDVLVGRSDFYINFGNNTTYVKAVTVSRPDNSKEFYSFENENASIAQSVESRLKNGLIVKNDDSGNNNITNNELYLAGAASSRYIAIPLKEPCAKIEVWAYRKGSDAEVRNLYLTDSKSSWGQNTLLTQSTTNALTKGEKSYDAGNRPYDKNLYISTSKGGWYIRAIRVTYAVRSDANLVIKKDEVAISSLTIPLVAANHTYCDIETLSDVAWTRTTSAGNIVNIKTKPAVTPNQIGFKGVQEGVVTVTISQAANEYYHAAEATLTVTVEPEAKSLATFDVDSEGLTTSNSTNPLTKDNYMLSVVSGEGAGFTKNSNYIYVMKNINETLTKVQAMRLQSGTYRIIVPTNIRIEKVTILGQSYSNNASSLSVDGSANIEFPAISESTESKTHEFTINNPAAGKSIDIVVNKGSCVIMELYGVESTLYPVTINHGWASFCAPEDVELPEGVTAYYAKEERDMNDDVTLYVVAIDGNKVPANEGVILSAETDGAYQLRATTDAPALADNRFGYTTKRTANPNVANTYTLWYDSDEDAMVFAKYTGAYIPANKAYYTYNAPGGGASAPKRIRLVMTNENTATGIESQELKANSQKLIENGQLIIIKNGVRYNAQGQIVK